MWTAFPIRTAALAAILSGGASAVAIAQTTAADPRQFDTITIEKRNFEKVDADKDGKVMPEEVQAFIGE